MRPLHWLLAGAAFLALSSRRAKAKAARMLPHENFTIFGDHGPRIGFEVGHSRRYPGSTGHGLAEWSYWYPIAVGVIGPEIARLGGCALITYRTGHGHPDTDEGRPAFVQEFNDELHTMNAFSPRQVHLLHNNWWKRPGANGVLVEVNGRRLAERRAPALHMAQAVADAGHMDLNRGGVVDLWKAGENGRTKDDRGVDLTLYPHAPAFILEAGFLTNEGDAEKLKKYSREIGLAVARAAFAIAEGNF